MNYRTLPDAQLAEFGKNVATRLAGHEVTGFDAGLQDHLGAELGPLAEVFETTVEECVQITAAKRSAIAKKHEQRISLIAKLAVVHNYLMANQNPRKDYAICDLHFRKAPSTVVPDDPTKLTAVPDIAGVAHLSFSGNNTYGAVVYEISRRCADAGAGKDWDIIGFTRKQSYLDENIFATGRSYEYRIRAVAAKNVSNFSDAAVVRLGAPQWSNRG